MGKTFRKLARVGIAKVTYGGSEIVGAGKSIEGKKKKNSTSTTNTEDKTTALEEERNKLRKSLFALQEQQRASELQNSESTLGNPLSRW